MDVYSSFIHIAKTWKQPRCPSEGEWINKLWHIQTVGYYSVIKKKNELLNPEKTWRNLKCIPLSKKRASLVAQLVKNPPAMWETWVRFLGWQDPLEKGKATTPVFWPGEFHGLYSPWGHKESDTTEQLSLTQVKKESI